MAIIKDIFIEITKIKSVRRSRFSKNIEFNGHNYLNKPRYSTLLGLLLISNNDFDGRINNSILKHSPLPEIPVTEPEVETVVKETKKPGKIIDIFRKIMKDENNDDAY
jgi:hypothetical protein